MANRRIAKGDELRLKTTGAIFHAVGDETSKGEVLVISIAAHPLPFYIAANMVEIVETETEGSTENEIS